MRHFSGAEDASCVEPVWEAGLSHELFRTFDIKPPNSSVIKRQLAVNVMVAVRKIGELFPDR